MPLLPRSSLRLYKRLEERGYEVQMSDEALKLLSANGYDPVYGARPLKRAIQQQIENPLAQQILSGELVPGKTIELGSKRRPHCGSAVNHKTTKTGPAGSFLFKNQARIKAQYLIWLKSERLNSFLNLSLSLQNYPL